MKILKKISFVMMCVLLGLSLITVSKLVKADSSDNVIDMSDTNPSESGSGWTYNDGIYTILDGADITVVGDNGGSGRRILIEEGVTATLTLSGTTITGTSNNTAPISLDNNTNLTIILAEETINTLSGASTQASGIQMGLANQATVTATLTIQGGGTLYATGGERWPGIGGRAGGTRTINIKGGTIIAQGGSEGAGIGNGRSTPANSSVINIYGGTITATGGRYGAGIGGGYKYSNGDNGGAITIYGGIVKATGGSSAAGIGNGYNNSSGTSLSLNGNAVVFASSVTDTETSNKTSGILFVGNDGTVYGDVTVENSFEIESSMSLTIPAETSVTVADDTTITNMGSIVVQGTVNNNGTIENQNTITIQSGGKVLINYGSTYSGNDPSTGKLSYEVLWDTDGDGNVDESEYVLAGDTPLSRQGSKDSTASTIYTFTNWSPEVTTATQPILYTAQFDTSDQIYTVTLPDSSDSYSIATENYAYEMSYDSTFTFTIELAKGYYKTESFAVMVNNTPIQANENGVYSVTVKENVEITIVGINLDTVTTPTITASTVSGAEYTFDTWTSEDVIISIYGAEALSGIARYEYSIDGGQTWFAIKSYSATEAQFTISSETGIRGTTYLFRVVANSEAEGSASAEITVKIDKTNPSIEVSGDRESNLRSDTLTISLSTGPSGIYMVEVSKDGGEVEDITTSYADGYTITENGTYTFTVTNGAGVSTSETITYNNLGTIIIVDTSANDIRGTTTTRNSIMLMMGICLSGIVLYRRKDYHKR